MESCGFDFEGISRNFCTSTVNGETTNAGLSLLTEYLTTMTEDLNSIDTLFVAILAGGSSAEAEVSRNSAAQIQRALSQAGHSAVTIELDQHCAAALIAAQPDVVFPALHGPPAKTAPFRACWKCWGCPMWAVMCGVARWRWTRPSLKGVFLRSGLPVTADLIVRPEQNLQEAAIEIGANFGASLAIKPLNQGSAIGVQLLPDGVICLVSGRLFNLRQLFGGTLYSRTRNDRGGSAAG